MTTALRDTELIERLLPSVHRGGTILLRTEQGTMELRGDDLVLAASEEWLTIYHSTAASPEARSHLHLRPGSFRYARVVEREGATPFVGFWQTHEDDPEARPPLAIYFPASFDWAKGRAPIEENQQLFQDWVDHHGREFALT
ncbi:MAG: hypothetical protein ACE5KY_02145 [Candidatus Tectimicrobiota bacterium]